MPAVQGVTPLLQFLLGKETITEEDVQAFDMVLKITKEAPPVFLVATAEDLLTPMGALAVANRYSELGMPFELHIFQHGPHGYSLGTDVSANGSSQVLNPAYAQWQELSVQWLHKVFGPPRFEDRSTSQIGKYMAEMGIKLPGQGSAADFA